MTHADNKPAGDIDPMMKRKDAARILGVTTNRMARWAMTGDGPVYWKLGHSRNAPVRYRLSDLQAWLSDKARSSTSDTGGAR